jgi:hypothetical protein
MFKVLSQPELTGSRELGGFFENSVLGGDAGTIEFSGDVGPIEIGEDAGRILCKKSSG